MPNPSLSSAAVLARLRELADARVGLPIVTHRGRPIGPLVVGFKKVFRMLAQPMINEALNKQAVFNDELIRWTAAVVADFEAAERSMLAARLGLEVRMNRLDAVIARLEKTNAATPVPATELPKHN